ncbi:ribonuclease E inhibitor RraB [Neobacillus sp. MM2021_6]|uniref:ribonuclease E inhibitor RraB n=1 Tax=Bacillaceae TaxID=186817 RepID=UPI00140DB327|nr:MULTISPECIES: ribonuclease E inhibitor RraB [Bacillaceae]MBO0959967.1 ribonuclease E inhibitor RraB [Neobacillus sp. MM2021_6]NHC18711.1 ribonuclease E inhibitor RraB [Bacillus sp. MM2020_4]
MKFPNDADGKALQSLYKDGVNFKKPQSVEFFVAVPDQATGEKLSLVLKAEGFNCFVEQDDETEEWACCCSKKMLLHHNELMNIQKKLNIISKPHGGFSDGWGVFVD